MQDIQASIGEQGTATVEYHINTETYITMLNTIKIESTLSFGI